jgi:superfamily I DNA and/or RNA helicase
MRDPQGTEADIVIVSTVRSLANNWSSSEHVTSFMKDARRLNVALSRAK